MKKQRLKKIITKKRTGIAVSILALGIVFAVIFGLRGSSVAADSLPGIVDLRSDITTKEAPYNILEIVPNESAAEIGYLIKGQEPLRDSTGAVVHWEEYIKAHAEDMTPADREAYINSLFTYNSAYIASGSSDTMPMYYSAYQEVTAGTPDAREVVVEDETVYGYLQANTSPLYGWNAKFAYSNDNITYDVAVGSTKPYYIVSAIKGWDHSDFGSDTIPEDDRKSNYRNYLAELVATNKGYLYLYQKDGSYAGADTQGRFVPACTVSDLMAAYTTDPDSVDFTLYYLVDFKVLDVVPADIRVVYEATDFVYISTYAPYILMETGADQKHHTLTISRDNIYYTGGYVSNEWFKRFVLDIDQADCDNYYINVTVATPKEVNQMSSAELDNYDFIYFNAGTSKYGSDTFNYVQGSSDTDLTVDSVKNLFEKICNDKTPCITDFALIKNASGDQTNSGIYALSCMLMQNDFRSILNADGTLDTSKIQAGSSSMAGWVTYVNERWDNGYKDYVTDNVMVINTKEGQKLTDNFHTSAYSDADVEARYAAVLDEITTENLYRSSDTTAGYAPLDNHIYKSTIVRYIINFVGKREVVEKTAVNVLEIQPAKIKYSDNSNKETDGNELSPATIRKWLGVGNTVSVNIETVTTNEFVGRINDLNSDYDLIYIGADIYQLNNNSGETKYRDTSMNGLIYSCIGDKKKVKAHFAGLLDTDYTDSSRSEVYAQIEARYNGNDISAGKHNDLVDYVKGSYPVVVADKLCTGDAPNGTYVDNCTYLYSFLEEHLTDANVFRVSEVKDGKNAEFKFYANRGKLSIGTKVLASQESSVTNGTAFVVPGTADTSDDTEGHVSYIERENGNFYLKYKFTISNDGAVYDNTRYKAALYLDSNSDGKFSAEYEEIADITLTHAASGSKVANGELVAGEQYILTRQVPDSYSGVLTWKVEVSQTTNKYVRDSITGYTKLKDDTKGPVTIKVLHVHKDTGAYLDLEDKIGNTSSSGDTDNVLHYLVWGGTYNSHYYEGITDDFKFEFTSISNKDFNRSYASGYLYRDGNKTTTKFNLMDYDMFVLGFYDSYSILGTTSEDISEAAINGTNGIKEFIDSGKGVLFAHDTTSFTAINDMNVTIAGTSTKIYRSPYNCSVWAYTLNKNIRDMVGLDAYGVSIGGVKNGIDYTRISSGVALKDTDTDTTLKDALTNTLDSEGHYKIGLKQLAYKPKSGKTETVAETQGLTYNWMQMFPSEDTDNTAVYRKGTGAYKVVSKAEKVNEGQLTTYPYYLGDEIVTAPTHSQYYTLDLNADDDGDGETDLVVWYTLAGNTQYTNSPKDVVNNYYIYNKGNITYTGIGHSASTTTVAEGKLFINTMVAAYNSSVKEPDILVYESKDNLSPTTTFYEYGDIDNNKSFREESTRMYFSVSDTNIIRGSKVASAEYYVALGSDAASRLSSTATTYTVNGKTYPIYRDSDGVVYIKLSDLGTYTKEGTKVDASKLQCSIVYYVDIPTEVFDIAGVSNQNVNTFMVSAKTTLNKVGSLTGREFVVETSTTFSKIDFVHVELYPLD